MTYKKTLLAALLIVAAPATMQAINIYPDIYAMFGINDRFDMYELCGAITQLRKTPHIEGSSKLYQNVIKTASYILQIYTKQYHKHWKKLQTKGTMPLANPFDTQRIEHFSKAEHLQEVLAYLEGLKSEFAQATPW